MTGLPLFDGHTLADEKPAARIVPAARDTETSRAAARSVEGSAAHFRSLVFNAIARAGRDGLTADEAADQMALSVLTVRPRVSELNKAGAIVDTGTRRANRSGRTAIVWRAIGRAA